MAQKKQMLINNTKMFTLPRDVFIIASFYSIFYGVFQILEISIDCYRIACATTIIMRYLPYLKASKKPWSIFLALTKPYFNLLSKFLPTFYLGNIGYDFSLLFSLEILRVLAKLLNEAKFWLFFFYSKNYNLL